MQCTLVDPSLDRHGSYHFVFVVVFIIRLAAFVALNRFMPHILVAINRMRLRVEKLPAHDYGGLLQFCRPLLTPVHSGVLSAPPSL
jgi:hypothetical protein